MTESFPALTPDRLKEIGEALNGRHWQSDMAREAGVTKGQITRLLMPVGHKGRRTPTTSFAATIDRVIVDKIEDVARLIGHPGSPIRNEDYREAKRKIMEGVKLLRKYTPKVERVGVEDTSTRVNKPGRKPKK
jgi:hypothetical protein